MRRDWSPTAPSVKYDRGSFSFLIAMGRQLELALELEKDGSAPDFVIDALGVLQNGLEGITGDTVDTEEDSGGDDDGSDADLGEASGLPAEDEDGSARRRSRSRAVDGSLPGTRARAGLTTGPVVTMRRLPPPQPAAKPRPTVPRGTSKKVKRGTKSKR